MRLKRLVTSVSERILVRRMAALGDVLNTSPVVRRLRAENPDAEIYFQTLHPAAYIENPNINGIAGPHPDGRWHRLIDLDMAFERNRKVHQIDAFMLAAFGDAEGDKMLEFTYPSEMPRDFDIDWSRAVVMHPNTSWASRTLPQGWWQGVADMMVEAGLEVVVTGTPMDQRVTGKGIRDLLGQLTLPLQATAISLSRAALCGPSGIGILVGATDTPLVALCTITHAKYAMPYRRGIWGWNYLPIRTPMPCYGCYDDAPPAINYDCKRGDNACTVSFDMKNVVDAVLFAIRHDLRNA